MVGLVDIAESTRTVEIKGKKIPVYGVSAKGIASLFRRFPEIQNLFKPDATKTAKWDADSLSQLLPDALAAILACGTGSPDDFEAEAQAEKLNASDQTKLFEAIMEETMPDGPGPFVERLMAIVKAMGVDLEPGAAQAGISQGQSKP